jgi:tetratricopeptide (TPR) repeat protein
VTVVDGTIYLGSNDNNLYAVDAATGEEEWSFETGNRIHSSPAVADGTAYIGSHDNSVYAVDAATGKEEWAYGTEGRIYSSATVVDGTAYVGSDDSYLYAITTDASVGKDSQQQSKDGDVVSDPAGADDAPDSLEDISEVDSPTAETLRQAGYDSVDDIVHMSQEELSEIGGIGDALAARLKAGVGGLEVSSVEKSPTKEQNEAQTTVGDSSRPESIETVRGVDKMVAESLRNADYDSPKDLIMLSSAELLELSGVDEDRANRIKSHIDNLVHGEDKNSISKSRDVLSEKLFKDAINRAETAVASGDTEQAEEIYKNLLTHLEDALVEFDTLSPDNEEKITERLKIVGDALDEVENANKINRLRTAATESIETANDSQTNEEFEFAERQYEEAISDLEQASELCDSSTDEYQDITEKIEVTKESLSKLRERKEFVQSEGAATGIIESADKAKNNCEFGEAEEQYREALEHLEQAKEVCDSSTDDHQNVVDKIQYVRKNIELTSDLTGKRPTLTETLTKAERSFQEGVAGYVDDDQTVAKIRFRQARDEFENARQIIENSDDFLLNQPVDVTTEPQLSPPVNTIAKFTRITDATVEMLSSMSIEAIEDLQVDDGGLQPSVIETFESRGAVTEEESTLLTILSWWDEGGSTEFGTATKIDCRFERSKYGFEKSK